MINFLSSWAKNLSLALIVVSILEMLLPNNKTKKYVKTIMGLYILFCIIEPFIKNKSAINNIINIESYATYSENVQVSENKENNTLSDKGLSKMYKQKLQEDITKKIENQGFIVEECDVEAHISENDSGIEKINLKLQKGDNENISNNNAIEEKIVTEIQKIKIGKQNNTTDTKENNVTTADINNVKNFLIKEYEVDEKCLKIN